MITSLRVRNFKRFTDASFALRPLTVLTGLNGTGKSTTIQALLLARQLAEAPGGSGGVVQLNGPYGLALGEASEVLHPDAPDSCIEIEIGLDGDAVGRAVTYRLHVPDEQALYLRVPEETPTARPNCPCAAADSPTCAPNASARVTSSGSPPSTPTSSASVSRVSTRPRCWPSTRPGTCARSSSTRARRPPTA
ncbi:AAA family ATPase [Streptomyces sp. INA 01156]